MEKAGENMDLARGRAREGGAMLTTTWCFPCNVQAGAVNLSRVRCSDTCHQACSSLKLRETGGPCSDAGSIHPSRTTSSESGMRILSSDLQGSKLRIYFIPKIHRVYQSISCLKSFNSCICLTSSCSIPRSTTSHLLLLALRSLFLHPLAPHQTACLLLHAPKPSTRVSVL